MKFFDWKDEIAELRRIREKSRENFEGQSTGELIGNPRVKGKRPDIGSYENQTGGLMLIVR